MEQEGFFLSIFIIIIYYDSYDQEHKHNELKNKQC